MSYAELCRNLHFFFVYEGQRIINKLRQKMLSAILKQQIAFFDKTSIGEFVNRLASDTNLAGKAMMSLTVFQTGSDQWPKL